MLKCYLSLLTTLLVTCPVLSDERSQSELLRDLRQMTDPDLQEQLRALLLTGDPRDHKLYEPCLLEATRRGGDFWRDELQRALDWLASTTIKRYEADERGIAGEYLNLELLTCLRRIEGRPDPIEIAVTNLPSTASTVSLPRLQVSLKNVDQNVVGISVGGDYRSGRLTRWRVVLTDESGQVLPVKPWPIGIDGGIMSMQLLQPGEEQQSELILDHRLQVIQPGKYKLQVLYHNTKGILRADSLDGYVLSKSKVLGIEIQPVRVKQSEAVIGQVQALVEQLDAEATVKLLVGPVGQWADDFISADSTYGKLLSIGLPAVPTLVEELSASDSQHLRAHLLALLFSLTNQNDPRVGRPLGVYKYLNQGWSIKNGPSFGQSSGTRDYGDIDPAAQEVLVKRWRTWVQTAIEIER